ncbi:MAG: hypothetical protein JW937_04990 [Candidatus Omnitrophica bacterium]|nr:hypothetical protein [Candidatus Omnitrophota bacterium]
MRTRIQQPTTCLVLIGAFTLCVAPLSLAAEGKKVVVTGEKAQVGAVAGSLGAVSFVSRAGEASYSLSLDGSPTYPAEAVIDGHNFDTSGNLAGSGDRPGAVTDLNAGVISMLHTAISGDPLAIEGGVTPVDVEVMIDYFRQIADMVISADTTYNGSSAIGSPGNYKIVHVDDARLTLQDDFQGFGVLFIEDKTPAASRPPRLIMENNAQWTGLVLVYQHDVAGSVEDVTRLQLIGTPASPFDAGDFALLALDRMAMHNHQDVASGNVGVVNAGGWFSADSHGVWGGSIMADNLSLDHHATVAGDLHYNSGSVGHHSSIGGTTHTTLSLPLMSLPGFPSFSAGTTDLAFGDHSTQTLAAGSYRNISMGGHCVLYLSGGDYYLNSLSMGVWGEIYFQAPTNLHVAGDITIDNGFTLQAGAGSGLSAKDCVLYVAGDFDVDRNHVVMYANLYLPNGSFTGNNHIDLGGAFIAKEIEFHNHFNVPLVLDSAFGGGSSLVDQRPQILGAVLLNGREFHIPNDQGYCDILYSEQVLNLVDSEIAVRPYRWVDWRETE